MVNHDDGSVRVVVRIRPANDAERGHGYKTAVTSSEDSCNSVIVTNSNESFSFDAVANESTTQADIFNMVGRDVVDNLMEGYSCCIFAYGQTGAGKTHTMQGSNMTCNNNGDCEMIDASEENDDERGLIPRVLQYLFRKVEEDKTNAVTSKTKAEHAMHAKLDESSSGDTEMKDGEEGEEDIQSTSLNYDEVEYRIRCSYVEIYNETVSDLLNIESMSSNQCGSKKILTIREDSKRGVFVDGVTEEHVDNADDTYNVFMKGSQNRAVGSTAMNRESSRSHSVFTISLESKRCTVNLGNCNGPPTCNDRVISKRSSTLHLVDLAGSERQKHSEATGQTLKEATAINKSLSALGNVIKALVDINSGRDMTRCHIPYRDSKLTFLLKDALGGNSKCAMIANISPAMRCYDETLSTLMFAQRVKLVTNKVTKNEEAFGTVNAMQEMIKQLNHKIEVLSKNGADQEVVDRNNELEIMLKESLYRANYAEEAVATQLNSAHAKIKSLQELTEKLERALQSQKMIVRLRDDSIKRIQEKTQQSQSNSEAHTHAATAAQVDAQNAEIEILRKQVDCHPDVVKYRMEIESLQRDMSKLQHELKEKDANAFNKSVSRQLAEVLQLKHDLSRQLEVARRSVMKMEEIKSKAEGRAKEVTAAFEAQTCLQEELMGHLSATSKERDDLTSELENAEAAVSKYVSALATVSTVKSFLSEELHNTKNEAAATNASLVTQLQEACTRYSDLEQVRVRLKNDVAALYIELAQLSTRYETLNKRRVEVETRNSALQNDLERMKEDREDMMRNHASNIAELTSDFQVREENLQLQANEMEAKLVSEKAQLATEAASKIAALKDDYNALIQEHKDSLNQMEDSHRFFTAELTTRLENEASSREEHLRSEMEKSNCQYESQISHLKQHHDSELTELKNSHESHMNNLTERKERELLMLQEQNDKKYNDREEDFVKERANFDEKLAFQEECRIKGLNDLKAEKDAELESRIAEIESNHATILDKAEKVHFEAITSLSDNHLKELDILEEKHKNEMQMREREYEQLVQANQSNHLAKIEELDNAHREELSSKMEETRTLKESNDVMKVAISNMEAQVKDHQDHVIQSKNELEALRNEIVSSKAESQASEAELNKKLHEAIDSATHLQETIDELQSKVDHQREEKENLHTNNLKLIEDLQNSHKDELDKVMADHVRELQEQSSKLQDVVKENNDLINELHSMKSELAEIRKRELDFQNLQSLHSEELERKEAEGQTLQRTNEELQREVTAIENSLAALKRDHELQSQAHQQRLKEVNEQHDHQIEELNVKLSEAETVNECVYNEVRITSERYEKEVGELKSRREELVKELEIATSKESKALKSVQEAASKLAEAEEKNKELHSEVERLRKCEQEQNSMAETTSHLEDYKNQLREAKSDIETLQNTITVNEQTYQEQEKKLKSLLQSRESELSSVNTSYDQLAAKLLDSEEKIKFAESRENELRTKLDTRNHEISSLKQKQNRETQYEFESNVNTVLGESMKSKFDKAWVQPMTTKPTISNNDKNTDNKNNESKKRARRPLGEVQVNEIEMRSSSKGKAAKKNLSAHPESLSGADDCISKPATRYSLRSRTNNATYA